MNEQGLSSAEIKLFPPPSPHREFAASWRKSPSLTVVLKVTRLHLRATVRWWLDWTCGLLFHGQELDMPFGDSLFTIRRMHFERLAGDRSTVAYVTLTTINKPNAIEHLFRRPVWSCTHHYNTSSSSLSTKN